MMESSGLHAVLLIKSMSEILLAIVQYPRLLNKKELAPFGQENHHDVGSLHFFCERSERVREVRTYHSI